MNRRALVTAGAILLALAVISGMQLADPHPEPSPKQVEFDTGPAAYTKDAIRRLGTVNHRMHWYASDSPSPKTDPYINAIVWSDVKDREYRTVLNPSVENPGIMYENPDGEWIGQANETWRYRTWEELSVGLMQPRRWFELPENSSAYSVERETSQVVVVRVNDSVVSGEPNGTAFITIEKPTGNVRRIQQRTRVAGNVTQSTLAVFDHHGDVDVTRPSKAEYTLEVHLYDLQRGPIPLHRIPQLIKLIKYRITHGPCDVCYP